MQINTKYSIGDTVWLMYDNKPYRGKIEIIGITVAEGAIYIEYKVRIDGLLKYFAENDLFATKEELMKFVFQC